MSLNPSAIEPQRNPGIITRVFRAIVGNAPDMGPQPAEQQTSETGKISTQSQGSARQLYASTGRDRLNVYADADEMDGSSAEFARALHAIANNATASEDGEQQSFDIECEDEGAKAVIDDLIERVDLHEQIASWTRRTVKYGDSFAEIVVNDPGAGLEVAAVKQLPSATMTRNEDDYGNLLMGEPSYSGRECTNQQGECAFEQTDTNAQDSRVVAAFYPWQVVHARLFWDGVSKYGISLANVARRDWRKLHALEEGMVIGRLTRAYLKLIIYAEATGMSKGEKTLMLQNLQKSIGQTNQYVDQKRGRELFVLDNIYLTKEYVRAPGGDVKESQTKVDLIDPKNEGLQVISDVIYFQRKYLTSLIMPPAFMAIEDQVNAKATLTKEDVEWVRFIRSVQKLMSGAVSRVIDTELILKGYDPDTVDYEIKWPTISTENEAAAADTYFKEAQGDDIYMGFGAIDKAWIQAHRFGMTEEEAAEIEEPEPVEPPVVPPPPQAPVPTPSPGKVMSERLTPYLETLAVSNQRIYEAVTNGNGKRAIEAELIPAIKAEVVTPAPDVHVHFGPDSIRNDVTHEVTVQPADVKSPDVHVHTPEHPAPQVSVNVPKQAAPQVTVNVPEQAAPNITVQAPNVTVQAPEARDVTIERNRDGSIKGIKQK